MTSLAGSFSKLSPCRFRAQCPKFCRCIPAGLLNMSAPAQPNPRWVAIRRFNLRSLFLAVTLAGCVSGYLAYFRSAEVTIVHEFRTVTLSDLRALGLELNHVASSPYKWALLSEGQARSLVARSGNPEAPHLNRQTRVRRWPMQSVSWSFLEPVFLDVKDPRQGEHPAKLPLMKSGMLNGFFGVRRAGGDLELRIEVQASYSRPDDDVESTVMSHPKDSVAGSLFYQGAVPEHGLAFLAPLDGEAYHVVLFTVDD